MNFECFGGEKGNFKLIGLIGLSKTSLRSAHKKTYTVEPEAGDGSVPLYTSSVPQGPRKIIKMMLMIATRTWNVQFVFQKPLHCICQDDFIVTIRVLLTLQV